MPARHPLGPASESPQGKNPRDRVAARAQVLWGLALAGEVLAAAEPRRGSRLSAGRMGLVATTIAVPEGRAGSGNDQAGSGTERAILWPAVEQRREGDKGCVRDANAAHEVSILMMWATGRCWGWQPGSNTSIIVMSPPQQGKE